MTLHYGVIVPNFGAYSNPQFLATLAAEAEATGWEGFFLWDQIVMDTPEPVADPWIALALIAAATQHIRLGPMVTPLARRRPQKVARETVTLDHLSNGRLILGVGLGAFQDHEFEALGDSGDPRVRAARLDEGLAVLTGLWRGEPFSYDGQYYHIQAAHFLPRPVQHPRIPIWVAGNWPRKAPFRRAARWDGVIPGWDIMGGKKQTPDEVREMLAFIAAHRTTSQPFEVAFGGKTPGGAAAEDAAIVAPYAAAGITWWLEDLNPWRGSAAAMQARIRRGPPRL